MSNHYQHQLTIPETLAKQRLDKALGQLLPEYSRARLQTWIKAGAVTVNGQAARPRDLVAYGDDITINAELEPKNTWAAQDLSLDVIFEDADLLVINKPVGLVVHPGAGVPDSTLVNALLHYDADLAKLPRAGIVHRLDKDTSGLLVVARSLQAHPHLVGQLQDRSMGRTYQAVVNGSMIAGGSVDAPIGRHPRQRVKMAVVDGGKPATTHYRILDKFRSHTLLQLTLESGRTHQIRVHMAHIHHPIVGDATYGKRNHIPKGADPALITELQHFPRQALHAARLSLTHPVNGESMTWHAPLPSDMQQLIDKLKKDQLTNTL